MTNQCNVNPIYVNGQLQYGGALCHNQAGIRRLPDGCVGACWKDKKVGNGIL